MKKFLKHYLIAHKKNDYIPKLLSEGSVAVLFAFIIASFGWVTLQPLFLGTSQTAAIYSSVLENLANADRTNGDLQTLNVNPVLEEAAQEKANDMAAKGYFAHYAPDGTSPWYWISKAGYNFSYAGENLAINFSDSNDVNNAWLASPTHRENILNPHYTEIGVAFAQGVYQGRETVFVVQMFGAPATLVKNIPKPRVAVVSKPQTRPSSTVAETSLAVQSAVSSTSSTVETGRSVLGAEKTSVQSNPVEVAVSNPRRDVLYLYGGIAVLLFIAVISVGMSVFCSKQAFVPKHMWYGLSLILLMLIFLGFIGLIWGPVIIV